MASSRLGHERVRHRSRFPSEGHNECSQFTVVVRAVLAVVVAFLLADLASGLYHWAIDNYGASSTPVFGARIEAFQLHHQWPWACTRNQFANNLHLPGQAVTLSVLPVVLVCDGPILHAFLAVWAGCFLFSVQIHAWAHGAKSQLPPLVEALQGAGLLLPPGLHLGHHRPPYNNNYCIVSGLWNWFLDGHKVFERLEMMLFVKLGVKPRSWSEAGFEWREETDAHAPQIAAN